MSSSQTGQIVSLYFEESFFTGEGSVLLLTDSSLFGLFLGACFIIISSSSIGAFFF
jgi:hypothetical protein